MESKSLELEARVLWNTGRWFKFLKWPSAHQVDFGDFLVEFDFKKGHVETRASDGGGKLIGSFTPQKRVRSIAGIEGGIQGVDGQRVEIKPAEAESVAAVKYSLEEGGEVDSLVEMGAGTTEWRISGNSGLISEIEGRDAFLRVRCSEREENLVLVLASLVVFLRFSH